MIGFVKRKVKSLTLGEKLKKIREKSGISLAEIVTHTKIKQDYLEKIEAGDFEKLPFDVYVKGFLRSYAKYLDLDPEKVIAQFNKEVGVRENVKKYQKNKNKKIDFKIPTVVITPKMISIFLSGLIVLSGFSYFYLEVDNFSKEPVLVLENLDSNQTTKSNSMRIAGFTDFENKVTINGELVFIGPEGKFDEVIGLQKGLNEIKVEAFNKFGKSTKKIIHVSADYELAILGLSDEKQPSKKEFFAEIEVRETNGELTLKIDQGELQTSILYPGNILKIKVTDELEISSSKPNNTYVKINKEDFFVLDKQENNYKKIIINKEGISNSEADNKN